MEWKGGSQMSHFVDFESMCPLPVGMIVLVDSKFEIKVSKVFATALINKHFCNKIKHQSKHKYLSTYLSW